MRRTAIALLSGGLDSAVALRLAQRTHAIVLALTFDYGQRAAPREIEASRALCRACSVEYRAIALPWLAESTRTALVDRSHPLPSVAPAELEEGAAARAEAVWVPNRNGVFIAIAAALAEAKGCGAVVAGFNAEEAATFPDNSSSFVEATDRSLALSTRTGVRLLCPTVAMTKEEIARRAVDLEIDPGLLWPCYDGGERLCGRCESCARTIRAFRKIGAWELIRNRFAEGTFA